MHIKGLKGMSSNIMTTKTKAYEVVFETYKWQKSNIIFVEAESKKAILRSNYSAYGSGIIKAIHLREDVKPQDCEFHINEYNDLFSK